MADNTGAATHLGELNNLERMYRALYEAAAKLHREEDYAKSDTMLEKLLLNEDLPIILEARCHMLLGTSDTGMSCVSTGCRYIQFH